MSIAWKVASETLLMKAESPIVLTTSDLGLLADIGANGRGRAPSRATISRWIAELVDSKKLLEVTKGVFINRLGHRDESPAAAAHWIRRGSVVSLSWVLEQAGLTNNFGDTITCVIPTHPSWTKPQIKDRVIPGVATFKFHAMHTDLVDEAAGSAEDRRDLRFSYARATPEKALLDWIYLANDHRSRLQRPPLDIELDRMDRRRLKRLARTMGLEDQLRTWVEQWNAYQGNDQVRSNSANLMLGQ